MPLYRSDLTVVSIFESEARQHPCATAAIMGSEHLTYAQMNQRANRAARRLRMMGVGPGVLVGICLERSLEMILGPLAVLKTGAAYLPLDPELPVERLRFMIEDARAQVLVTQKSLFGLTPPCPMITFQELSASTNQDRNQEIEIRSDNLAYVIYTSGSTGKPKGVEITHGSLSNLLLAMQERPGIKSDDRLLAVTSFSFDIAGLEIFLPLITGACVVLLSGATAADARALISDISRCAPTVMQATPSTWRMLLDSGWQGSSRLKILCGGERLSRELASELLSKSSSLWNLYGPTETTIWSTACHITSSMRRIPVGRPIRNTQIYILDKSLSPVSRGCTGEIFISGAGVARGYVNRPDLTSSKFLRDPFSPDPSQRMYRTGDVGHEAPDGQLEITGRMDDQIKFHGYRIEPGEIEAVLREHSSVKEAVVVEQRNRTGVARLVAYLVPNAPLSRAELRAFLGSRVPQYMIPSLFIALNRLPLTPNRKVDRNFLSRFDDETQLQQMGITNEK